MKQNFGSLEFRKLDNKVYVQASIVKDNKSKFVSGWLNKPEVQSVITEFTVIPSTDLLVE